MSLADEVRNLLRAVDEHWECFPPIDSELAAVRAALDRHTAAVAAADRLAEFVERIARHDEDDNECDTVLTVRECRDEMIREAKIVLAAWKAAKE